MICKKCGAFNEDYLEYCEACSAPITNEGTNANARPDEEGNLAWRFVSKPEWPVPEFDANTVSEDDIPASSSVKQKFSPQPAYREEPAPGDVQPSFSVSEEGAVDLRRTRRSSVAQATRTSSGMPRQEREEREAYVMPPVKRYRNNDVQDEDDEEEDLPRYRPSRSRARSRRGVKPQSILFIAAIAVLVIAIVVFAIVGINKNYGSASAFIASVFGGSPTTKPATIEKTTSSDGSPAYLLTVYAKKNYKARFRAANNIDQTIDVEDGFAAFRISEAIWAPTESVESAAIEVTPDITLIAPDGTETKVEFEDKISVSVPALTLGVTTPPTDAYTASTQDITIAGTVSDASAEVFVGDIQLQVDSAGNFTGTYKLSGEEKEAVTIEAKKAGYQIARKVINVEYASGGTPAVELTENGPLTLASTFDNRTFGSSMTVTGTTTAGSAVTVSGVTLSGAVTMDSAGGFKFVATVTDIKVYPVTITSTKDGKTSTKTVYLLHSPKTEDYNSAHNMDYARVKSNPTLDQKYIYKGKVEEIYQATPYRLVKFKLTTGEYIVVEYYYKYALDVGKSYKLCGVPNGMYKDTDMPMMLTWFTYDN